MKAVNNLGLYNERYHNMDFSQSLTLSYYKTIATLNETHNIFLVQHQDTHKIYVKKILTVYNIDIYKELSTHPICGIPKIVDYYENENQLILIEHYISGQSLEDIIATETLDLQTIIHYALELCDIFEKLHNLNPPIVHRDIKPSNIIITEHNHVVLIDFNAAKHFSDSSTSDTILLGTKGYAAPEQYGFGSSSPKTDIYGMGILLKELTSSLPDIPPAFMKIIEKCIQINPSDRYNTMVELKNALLNSGDTPKPKATKSFSYNELLPPGFRTHTAWKMLFAIPSYLFIFWMSLSLTFENTHGVSLWIERIFCLLVFLSIILVTFDYRNVHRSFPLCKSKHRIMRFFGIILLNILVVVALLILMIILLSFWMPLG